jgi:hypothetical protein
MTRVKDLYGFPVFHNEKEKICEILDFPHFPQETKQSRQFYFQLEKDNFNKRDFQFPLQINITERIVEIKYDNIEFITLPEIYDIIEKDKNRFINTNTFFKVDLVYENKICVLSILYYTICDNGTTTIQNIYDLLDFTFIKYNTKKFTKKFIKPRMKKNGNIPNDIEHIPLLPLLWLDYDENYNLIYFNHFKLIEDDKKLPF